MTEIFDEPSGGVSAFERPLPQDMDAEQSVIGGMLLSTQVIEEVAAALKAADFYRPAHQTIYSTILDLYGQSRAPRIDPIILAAELDARGELARVGGAAYLHECVHIIPTASNAPYYAEIVHDRALLRRVIEAGIRITQLGYTGAGDAPEILDGAMAELQAAATGVSTADVKLAVADRWMGFIDELESGRDPNALDTPWMDLNEVIELKPGQLITIGAATGGGKALALDTLLPTPAGWTTMGDIEVGGYLLGADGKPCRVIAATDVMRGRPCYEVEFSDGTVIVADAQHQWLTNTAASLQSMKRAMASYGRQRNQRTFPAVRTTAEIAATLRLRGADRRVNHSVTNTRPLDLPAADLPVAPYTLGAWLGDGSSLTSEITTADPEILDRIRLDGYEIKQRKNHLLYGISNESEWHERVAEGVALTRDGMPIRRAAAHVKVAHATIQKITGPNVSGWKFSYVPASPPREKYLSLQELLRGIGVLGNKHIPVAYLRASEQQRRDLLAGLLDTDGTVNKSGSVQFAVTSKRLAEDTFELIASLGYRPAMRTRPVKGRHPETSTCYVVSFTTSDKVVYLTRKAERLVASTRDGADRRYIVDVRPVDSVPVRCVEVDNADHLYLASRAFVPTHNSLLGMNLAAHVAMTRGKPVLVASLEMGGSELMARLTAAEATVDLDRLVRRKLEESDWQKIFRASDRMQNAGNFVLDDSPNLTLGKIRARMRWMASNGSSPAMVVADYLQLMTPDSPSAQANRTQEVAQISRGLKLLAMEFEIPVIALAQFNRGAAGRQPVVTDFKDSSSIEQDSNVILLMHRPLCEDGSDQGDRAGEVDLIVAKNRNGASGRIVPLSFQGHYARIRSMAKEF